MVFPGLLTFLSCLVTLFLDLNLEKVVFCQDLKKKNPRPLAFLDYSLLQLQVWETGGKKKPREVTPAASLGSQGPKQSASSRPFRIFGLFYIEWPGF